jgi:hypothetical protein
MCFALIGRNFLSPNPTKARSHVEHNRDFVDAVLLILDVRSTYQERLYVFAEQNAVFIRFMRCFKAHALEFSVRVIYLQSLCAVCILYSFLHDGKSKFMFRRKYYLSKANSYDSFLF